MTVCELLPPAVKGTKNLENSLSEEKRGERGTVCILCVCNGMDCGLSLESHRHGVGF